MVILGEWVCLMREGPLSTLGSRISTLMVIKEKKHRQCGACMATVLVLIKVWRIQHRGTSLIR